MTPDGDEFPVPAGSVEEARPAGDWCLWQATTGEYRQLESG